ncbi:MAG: O-antigen polymerase [Clostridia bacterium]
MNYIISTIVIILSALLFKKASGNLKINLINISSFAFYSLMIFEFIGITLVYLGFRDHYLIQKISNNSVINITYWAMAYTMIVLPCIIIIANKFIFKITNINELYTRNINSKVDIEEENTRKKIYILVLVGLIICLIATIYVFICIGYIPFLKYFDPNFDFATERINIGRNFNGNQYIKNIIMLTITPILSYIAYIYMRTTKEKKWKLLFIISFILNIFIKTYDFSKAPIIYYICYFFIIEIMLGNTAKFRKIIPYIMVTIILIVILYCIIYNYNGDLISLSNGPLSRILITQAGTMFLHFNTFPSEVNYLYGHSFPPFTSVLFGSGEYDIRSGRVLMETYNKEAIKNGTAGVMSTAFIGEAYANFGFFGVVISPILVGVLFSAILCIYLKSKKTPLNIILYVESFIIFTTVLQGGIVEFLYNIQFLIMIIVIYGIKILSSEKLVNKLENIWRKRDEV